MKERINALLAQIAAFKPANIEELEQFRIATIGLKGSVTLLFDEFKSLPPEQKKELGQTINALKNTAIKTHREWVEKLQSQPHGEDTSIDITRTSHSVKFGSVHPLTQTLDRIESIFHSIGYEVAQGPELEDDYHVFTALNFPPEHPARDMQDTFFISRNPDILLRTHTSSVQIRVMQSSTPPIRVICPGRVFRNEDISKRAHCQFHQVEALYIDKNVSFADLKQTLNYFAKQMFGQDVKTRFRPSYFPFTEPSTEVDISCEICHGEGCSVCKGTGWLEILGAGMVDPNVLAQCGIDPNVYSGFALGMGVERIAMLRYHVSDIRYFFENDVRFLEQF